MKILDRQLKSPSVVRGLSISYRPELDGIRGLAIIIIVFHHFDYVGMHYFGGRGFLAVDVFFVLSGFLITQILLDYREKGKKLRSFYMRRVMRLYPILLISTLGLSYYLRNDYFFLDRSPAIQTVLYIKNFWPWGGVFGPMWSLSAEEQFYLIFPFVLLVGLKLLSRKKLSIFLSIWLAAIWTTALLKSAPDFNFNSDGIFNLVVFRPSIILVGSLIALNKAKLEDIVRRSYYVTLFLFIALIYLTLATQFPPLAGIATGLLILLLSESLSENFLPSKALKNIMGFKPLAWIGLLSYSIYIWHLPMIFFATDHFTIQAISNVPLFLLKLLGFAIVSFYIVERPILELISKKSAQ
jgi:peptidoglycan/LPS O-acetylase OafA/YrhL